MLTAAKQQQGSACCSRHAHPDAHGERAVIDAAGVCGQRQQPHALLRERLEHARVVVAQLRVRPGQDAHRLRGAHITQPLSACDGLQPAVRVVPMLTLPAGNARTFILHSTKDVRLMSALRTVNLPWLDLYGVKR